MSRAAPAFGLVGRVGNGPWVQVGTGPTTLSGTGALVFSVNDYYSTFWDNSGSFSVTVTVTGSSVCFPGWGRSDTKHPHVGPPGLLDSCYPGNGGGEPPTIRMPGHQASPTIRAADVRRARITPGPTTEASRARTLRPTATASTPPATLLTPQCTAKTRSRTSSHFGYEVTLRGTPAGRAFLL